MSLVSKQIVTGKRSGIVDRPKVDHLADFTQDPRIPLMSLMALPVGAMGAVVALVLVWLIGVITNLSFFHRLSASFVSPDLHPLSAWVILVPAIGGLIVGIMARYGSEQIRGHGIPEALEAILLEESRIKPRLAILKPLSSAISIGTGGPFGAEGPIIMTGGAFGSLFGQLFRMTAEERKTLLVAGAAAGMAAIFAAPVSAVLIAVELLLFEWKPRSFIPVSLACVVAAALRMPLLGNGPIFPVPAHPPLSLSLWAVAGGIGVLGGVGSSFLTVLVYAFEDLFRKLPIHWMWWPAVGGLAVGVAGWLNPRVLGVGYDTIHALLDGQVVGWMLLGLLVGKSLAWAISLGSGTSGGVLAPLLIIGGALGTAGAQLVHAADPGLWAMISMAAVMGGTMRAPFTAMIFMLELTHDFNVLPALLVACTLADAVTVLMMRRSILTEKVARHGHHLNREYAVDPLEMQRVEEVMVKDVTTIPDTTTVREVAAGIGRCEPWLTHYHAVPVVDATGQLAGIITRSDVARALHQDPLGNRTALEAGSQQLVVGYPDELVYDSVVRMLKHDIGCLPIVERKDARRLVGYLGDSAILSALLRQIEQDQVQEPGWLTPWGTRIVGRIHRNKGKTAAAALPETPVKPTDHPPAPG